jgi:hypothetical protein
MKSRIYLLVVILITLLITPSSVLAHKPRIVQDNPTFVHNPEISQAFYDELSGVPHVYIIETSTDFNLYVNLLVPKSSNPSGRYSADIYRIEEGTKILLGSLVGGGGVWKEFYEEFAGDYYLQGAELRKRVPAGHYEIIVFSDGNKGKYVLAVGETESFGLSDLLSIYTILPRLKRDFFHVSIMTLLSAKMGIPFIVGIAVPLVALVILAMFWLRRHQ